VTAVKVEKRTLPAHFEYVGVAESSHIVELRARVEGYLMSINYLEGSLVKKGDLLFVLDQRPFEAALQEAAGELAKQEAILWNDKQQTKRMIPLYEKNAVSQKDLDDAIAAELATEASVITAKGNVYKAEINLGFASIHSPVTAMAGKAEFREGALISPGPNSLLTNLYVVDPIWVNFSISQGDILKIRQEERLGQVVLPKEDKDFQIEIVMPDNSILPAEGTVSFRSPALQQSTGTMLVRSVVSNPEGWLSPGQFVRVIIKGAIYPDAIAVPQTALLQGPKGQFVYVINEQNQVEMRQVKTGDWYQKEWLITSGLNTGDIVVTQGVNKIQTGSCVEVTEWYTPPKQDKSIAESAFVYDLPLLH
jgi:membrane fusion protein (multidrug efflux system)